MIIIYPLFWFTCFLYLVPCRTTGEDLKEQVQPQIKSIEETQESDLPMYQLRYNNLLIYYMNSLESLENIQKILKEIQVKLKPRYSIKFLILRANVDQQILNNLKFISYGSVFFFKYNILLPLQICSQIINILSTKQTLQNINFQIIKNVNEIKLKEIIENNRFVFIDYQQSLRIRLLPDLFDYLNKTKDCSDLIYHVVFVKVDYLTSAPDWLLYKWLPTDRKPKNIYSQRFQLDGSLQIMPKVYNNVYDYNKICLWIKKQINFDLIKNSEIITSPQNDAPISLIFYHSEIEIPDIIYDISNSININIPRQYVNVLPSDERMDTIQIKFNYATKFPPQDSIIATNAVGEKIEQLLEPYIFVVKDQSNIEILRKQYSPLILYSSKQINKKQQLLDLSAHFIQVLLKWKEFFSFINNSFTGTQGIIIGEQLLDKFKLQHGDVLVIDGSIECVVRNISNQMIIDYDDQKKCKEIVDRVKQFLKQK